jgi:protease I
MRTVLVPLPTRDFDPSESAVPWQALLDAGHRVRFATPDGRPAQADPRMLDGNRLGPLKPFLRADRNARTAHARMERDPEFLQPLRWDQVDAAQADALLLPGGHAPGMREYLESPRLQALVAAMFAADKPVAAVCHGVVLVARSRRSDGRSVLHGRKTTALLASQEWLAWSLTRAWLGNYYRTYPRSVQDEVSACLASPHDFIAGPLPLRRDAPGRPGPGFCLRDGNYLSARWPGDVHRLAAGLVELLAAPR